MITPLAEEFHRPEKDVPLSLFLAASCVAGLYIMLSFVTVGTHSYGQNGEIASLAMLISKGAGESGVYVTVCLALFITFATIHANIAGFSRMVYALAREGTYPYFWKTKCDKTYAYPCFDRDGRGVWLSACSAWPVSNRFDDSVERAERGFHRILHMYIGGSTETPELERFGLVDGARGVCGVRGNLFIQRLGASLSGSAGSCRIFLYENKGWA